MVVHFLMGYSNQPRYTYVGYASLISCNKTVQCNRTEIKIFYGLYSLESENEIVKDPK